MNTSIRVVEDTPQIHISEVKKFVSQQNPVVTLTINQQSGDKINYHVKTTTTPCYFGGERYWFECGICHKRAAILYVSDDQKHLFCRGCSNLVYRNQRLSKNSRRFLMVFDIEERKEAVFDSLERVQFLYKGLPTKRFKQYLAYRVRGEGLYRNFLLQ